MSISVVIPVFNELESLPILIDELKINLKDFDFWEIIFIDDGSSDGSTELLWDCLLYTSPSPRDLARSRMPSSA